MSDALDALLDALRELRRDLDEHKIATAAMLRVGPVKERDHEKGVRVEHGTDDAPDRSPWVQPSERSGVERDLPRVGEQVLVVAPYGDAEQGVSIPFGHYDDKRNPAVDADETVLFNRDGFKISVKDGSPILAADKPITLKVGDVSFELTSAGPKFTGGKITHDGRNIGSTHKHGGVQSGGSKTAEPE